MLEKCIFNSVDILIQKQKDNKKDFNQKQNEYKILDIFLQRMNIKFDDFVKELMKQFVAHSGYEILEKTDKKNKISFFAKQLIDKYIENAQTNRAFNLPKEFHSLKSSILKDKSESGIKTDHDIDLLFKDKNEQIYYVEIKYNDDHDTDKFIALNRKIIKTYAYLVRELGVDIKPVLFYFNNKKMKGNIYLPEDECIYRGERFFKEFLKFDYGKLQNIFENFAESSENVAQFNKLYQDIMKRG
ncbi:hypothetical protein CIG11343_1060 [Campylobacter iguaniorum]|uniref:HinfI family type II restriction enzyme n=1 Tax=Campylobacter iguaniorum TaxID=1244531 RepID=UPI0007C989AA|nr:hypothetical protein [Campylobacter iguaniorum]ANE36074.1 hypothetical protein CIG11343_1060 [Campylobacter iguaniorum]